MFMNGFNFFLLAIVQLFVFSFLLHVSDTIDDNLGWRTQPMKIIIEIIDNEGRIFRQCAIEEQGSWLFCLSGII